MCESYLAGRQGAKTASSRCEIFTRLRDDTGTNRIEGPRDERSRCLRVPTSAKALREPIDVDGSGAAKRHLHLTVAEVAEEDRHPRPRDGPRVLGDSVELLRSQRVFLHYSRG